jgi:hypothetical protein
MCPLVLHTTYSEKSHCGFSCERKTTVLPLTKTLRASLSFCGLLRCVFDARSSVHPGALQGPSRSRPSGLRRYVAGCALTPSTPASSRYLSRLLPNLRPPLLRRLRNSRSASSRQDALLHADDFTLRRAAQCFCSRSYPTMSAESAFRRTGHS